MRRRLLATMIAFVVRLWIRTLRFRRLGPEVTGPALIAFWHGEQLALLGQRPSGVLVAPISRSRDGDLQTTVMARFGVRAVRGSSSRGGAGALRGLLKALKLGSCALMAVDGPRGPRAEVKPGIVFLARRTGVPVYPVSVAVSRGRRLVGTWDRFLLPAPWARTVVCFGDPWRPVEGVAMETQCAALADALHGARQRAIAHLDGARDLMHIEGPLDRT